MFKKILLVSLFIISSMVILNTPSVKASADQQFCVDSDNGKDYFKRGTVTQGTNSKTDYCVGDVMHEYSCASTTENTLDKNNIKEDVYTCSCGCDPLFRKCRHEKINNVFGNNKQIYHPEEEIKLEVITEDINGRTLLDEDGWSVYLNVYEDVSPYPDKHVSSKAGTQGSFYWNFNFKTPKKEGNYFAEIYVSCSGHDTKCQKIFEEKGYMSNSVKKIYFKVVNHTLNVHPLTGIEDVVSNGSRRYIEWDSYGIDKVNIAYVSTSGLLTKIFDAVSGNIGECPWIVNVDNSINKKFKICMKGYIESNYMPIIESCSPYFEIKGDRPSIAVLSPNGGEKLKIGETYRIKWKSNSHDERIVIKYINDNNNNRGNIASLSSFNNPSFYDWTIPNSLAVGDKYKILVSNFDTGKEDTSNNYFSVIEAFSTCTSWNYSDWSSCSADGKQTRTITSSLPSNCVGGTPEALSQSCKPTCTSWTYSDWSSCKTISTNFFARNSANRRQTRTITSSLPSNCVGGTPEALSQSCTYVPPVVKVKTCVKKIKTFRKQGCAIYE
mgnify:CR=1 FL=1